jgi:hypothetical protein
MFLQNNVTLEGLVLRERRESAVPLWFSNDFRPGDIGWKSDA